MYNFPIDFIWGTSTSSYQIEGAWDKDFKGVSIWDTFSQKKGNIRNNETGNIACNHYENFKEDISLLKDLGIKSYRFSISWPRIIPNGIGEVNLKGIEFYDKLLDELHQNGIIPFVTLYHWDLPQALQDKGGFLNRDIVKWFSEYTSVVIKYFGEKISNYIIINEPSVIAYAGHYEGIHAPGIKDKIAFIKTTHHLNMCHGEGVRLIKREYPNANVGSTFTHFPIRPKTNSQEDIHASKIMDALWSGVYKDPIFLGEYPEIIKHEFKEFIKDGDMELINTPGDFIGINHYSPDYAKSNKEDDFLATLDYAHNSFNDINDEKHTDLGWIIEPRALYESLMDVKIKYNNPVIYITEGGAAFNDEPSSDNKIHDTRRIKYYKEYLKEVSNAIKDGANIKGYFAWSFLDNFEWGEGYFARFGLVYIDYKRGLKRVPKESFYWYKNLVNTGVIDN